MSLIGIDVGTTGVKAACFDEHGRALSHAYREYAPIYPQAGWVELDSEEVLRKTLAVLAEAAGGAGGDPVGAISISSMGEAATPVDAEGRILGRCIVSSDIRGEQYVQKLSDALGQEGLYRINPNILSTSYTMPKLCWLRDEDPDLWGRTDRFLLWDGMVASALGCEPYISYSLANRTLLFDIHQEDWSDELLALCGLERSMLPQCLPAGAVAGKVRGDVASQLGLPAGVKVVVGGHDQCCNALGAGIASAGRAVDGIGTYECIAPVYDHIPDPAGMLAAGLNVEHHVVPGLYVSFLFNQAGALVRWFRDTFARERRNEEGIYDALASEMPTDPTGLFVLPYFEPTGSPGYVADATGAILGLRVSTTRGEILKAIMESVSYYFAECLDGLADQGVAAEEFLATGGGAQSDAWMQLKADMYGCPLLRPGFTDCGLMGAAMLAGQGIGLFGSLSQATADWVTIDREFLPDSGRQEIYRERLAMYRKLFPLMYPTLSRMHTLPQAGMMEQAE